jgi:hypothetical protein
MTVVAIADIRELSEIETKRQLPCPVPGFLGVIGWESFQVAALHGS